MAESRFTDDQLIAMALRALEETVVQCRAGRLEPSGLIRFALAFLGNRIGDKTPFVDFWRAVQDDTPTNPTMAGQMRASAASGALFRIYVALGLHRPKEPG